MRTKLVEYLKAEEETKRCYAEYNAASVRLELAKVRERLSEIESQYQPLASNVESDEERQRHINTAFYVVVGRWHENR